MWFVSSLFGRGEKYHQDANKLLASQEPLKDSENEWNLNLALLRDAERSAHDPQTLRKIRFLEANYLSKAAPPLLQFMSAINRNLIKRFQLTPLSHAMYHREGFAEQMDLGAKAFNKNLALEKESPLLITDTVDINELFPLYFSVIQDTSQTSATNIKNSFLSHFEKYAGRSEGLNHPLQSNVLFDITSRFQKLISTKQNPVKEAQFREEFDKFKKEVLDSIKNVVEELQTKFPSLPAAKLKEFLQKNMICICRVDLGIVGGMKILPLFADLKGRNLREVHPSLVSFINKAGIYVNPLTMRRYLLDEEVKSHHVHYAVEAHNSAQLLARYFPKKDTLVKMNLWETISREFYSERWNEKSYICILGRPTLQLLKGLTEEISEKKWEELNTNPASCQVIQKSFVNIANHLASTHLHLEDFEKFVLDIEAIHSEISALLEFFSPFTEEDFPKIYMQSIQGSIPKDLHPHVRIGLGKTAVNIFAGINTALYKTNAHPVRVYSRNFYFEQAFLIGEKNSFETILFDPQIKTVDLYCGQFHANVQPQHGFTHYSTRDIYSDIAELLEFKPEIEHLTIAIDCTIDLTNSQKILELLETFKNEIKSGTLNFILFKSGQKTDMFGMDNYFGAPYYIINNGDAYWKEFNAIPTKTLHKTDPLSTEWFCLSNKYAADSMDAYRQILFDNARAIIEKVPASLLPQPKNPHQGVMVCPIDNTAKTTFIDVKIEGSFHSLKAGLFMAFLLQECERRGIKTEFRSSWGFPHINFNGPLQASNTSSIRICPSINPEENTAIVEFLENLATLYFLNPSFVKTLDMYRKIFTLPVKVAMNTIARSVRYVQERIYTLTRNKLSSLA